MQEQRFHPACYIELSRIRDGRVEDPGPRTVGRTRHILCACGVLTERLGSSYFKGGFRSILEHRTELWLNLASYRCEGVDNLVRRFKNEELRVVTKKGKEACQVPLITHLLFYAFHFSPNS